MKLSVGGYLIVDFKIGGYLIKLILFTYIAGIYGLAVTLL